MIFASIQLCKGSSMEEGNERTLSRRRRYLIFPEGSSLQIGKIDEIVVYVCVCMYVCPTKLVNVELKLYCAMNGVFIFLIRFSLVYDTYHPVVDYTNLLVVGITGALAWELPTKPVYPEEKLQEIYKNGSLPLLRRNGNNEEINNIQDESIRGITNPCKSYPLIFHVHVTIKLFFCSSFELISVDFCIISYHFLPMIQIQLIS